MHSVWRGAISFGLVHIPIRMYSASIDRALEFRLLHKKDLSEIRYARICKKEGKEIPWKDIVKGYEDDKGEYVVLTEEDFKRADPKKTETIDIVDFTDEKGVDSIYYDTPYYLEPEKGSGSAYLLLYEALKQSKNVAIGKFVFHHHEHIAVIRPYKNLLILQQLRYASEIKDPSDVNIPKKTIAKTELALALKLIKELKRPFKLEKYSDTYVEELMAIIKNKGKGSKTPRKRITKSTSSKIHSLTTLLKKSLKEKPKKKKAA